MSKPKHSRTPRNNDVPHSAPPMLAETGRGVSFVVDFQEGPKESKRRSKIQARLTDRSAGKKKTENKLVDYTEDESMLIAEIMRDSHLDEKKQKAGNVDVKIFDASRRRMCLNYLKEQDIAKKDQTRSSTGDITERRRRVKEMAESARRKAAMERSTAAERPTAAV